MTFLILQTGRLAASFLCSDLEEKKSQDGQTLGMCLSILTNQTLSLSLSERTIWQILPSTFLTIHLEEVQSFKLLGLTISHNLSWANHISKLASKASH